MELEGISTEDIDTRHKLFKEGISSQAGYFPIVPGYIYANIPAMVEKLKK